MSRQQIIETFGSVFNQTPKTFTEKLIAYNALANALNLRMFHSVKNGVEVFEFKKTEYSKKVVAVI